MHQAAEHHDYDHPDYCYLNLVDSEYTETPQRNFHKYVNNLCQIRGFIGAARDARIAAILFVDTPQKTFFKTIGRASIDFRASNGQHFRKLFNFNCQKLAQLFRAGPLRWRTHFQQGIGYLWTLQRTDQRTVQARDNRLRCACGHYKAIPRRYVDVES